MSFPLLMILIVQCCAPPCGYAVAYPSGCGLSVLASKECVPETPATVNVNMAVAMMVGPRAVAWGTYLSIPGILATLQTL